MAKSKLTPKQQAVIREKIKNPTISRSEAMRRAGYAEGTLKGGTPQRVEKSIQGSMKEALERAGLTQEALASRLVDVVHAKKVSRAQFKGEFGEERVDDDLPTSRAGIELAAKLRGDLVEKVEHSAPDYLNWVKSETARMEAEKAKGQ